MQASLTYDLLLVRLQLDLGVGLHEHLDEDQSILVAAADGLHEARVADALLIVHIAELCGVDARGADGRRREREPLTHGWWGKPGGIVIAIGRGIATQPSFWTTRAGGKVGRAGG